MKILNRKEKGQALWMVTYIPKGSKQEETVGVYAKSRLDASNYMILNRFFGKQVRIELNFASQLD